MTRKEKGLCHVLEMSLSLCPSPLPNCRTNPTKNEGAKTVAFLWIIPNGHSFIRKTSGQEAVASFWSNPRVWPWRCQVLLPGQGLVISSFLGPASQNLLSSYPDKASSCVFRKAFEKDLNLNPHLSLTESWLRWIYIFCLNIFPLVSCSPQLGIAARWVRITPSQHE